MRRSNSFPKKLKRSNQRSIMEVLQSRWEVLISVRGIKTKQDYLVHHSR